MNILMIIVGSILQIIYMILVRHAHLRMMVSKIHLISRLTRRVAFPSAYAAMTCRMVNLMPTSFTAGLTSTGLATTMVLRWTCWGRGYFFRIVRLGRRVANGIAHATEAACTTQNLKVRTSKTITMHVRQSFDHNCIF